MKRPQRVVLLASSRSYKNELFQDAALRLGVEVVTGDDVPLPFLSRANAALPLDYRDLQRSTDAIVEYARANPWARSSRRRLPVCCLGGPRERCVGASRQRAGRGGKQRATRRDACRFAAAGVPSRASGSSVRATIRARSRADQAYRA